MPKQKQAANFLQKHVYSILLFMVTVLIGSIVSFPVGASWDEPDNIYAGGVYARFVQKRFDPAVFNLPIPQASTVGERVFTQNGQPQRYPPVPTFVGMTFVSIADRIGWVLGRHTIYAFHIASIIFFAVLVVCMYQMALWFGLSGTVALLAAGMTGVFPMLVGHAVSNIKDIAQVALTTLSLFLLVRAVHTKQVFIGSIVWGLAMATKFNAIYVPIIWGVWSLSTVILKVRKTSRAHVSNELKELVHHGILIGLVGIVTMIIVWPYLWFDPVSRLREVVQYFTTIGQGYRVLWNGHVYTVGSGISLWWYPLVHFLVTIPESVLIFGGIGVVTLVKKIKHDIRWRVVGWWLLIPLLRIFSPQAAFYDGIRHFLELLPAIILVAALGVEATLQVVLKRYGEEKKAFIVLGVMAVTVGYMGFLSVLYFPYSTGYYNVFAARDANTKLDRDIAALSVKEAVDVLHHRVGPIRFWSPIGGHLSWYYLGLGDVYVYTAAEANAVYIVNKQTHLPPDIRRDYGLSKEYTLLHTIQRGGAVFGWIYVKE